MTRQYKAMQEELLKRLNVLENTIQEQKDQLGMKPLLKAICFSLCVIFLLTLLLACCCFFEIQSLLDKQTTILGEVKTKSSRTKMLRLLI
jgi:hypothetical protein